jgi:hypothetical protein
MRPHSPPRTGSAAFTTTPLRRRWNERTETGARWTDGWARKAVARWQRSRPLRRSLTGASRRPSGSRAPGRTSGGPGAWSPRGGWHVRHWVPFCPCHVSLMTLKALTRTVGLGLLRRRRWSWSGRRCRPGIASSIFRRQCVRSTTPRRGPRCSARFGATRGRPAALKLPLHKATERWLLAWRPTTLAAHRARPLTVVATLGACGPRRSRGCRCAACRCAACGMCGLWCVRPAGVRPVVCAACGVCGLCFDLLMSRRGFWAKGPQQPDPRSTPKAPRCAPGAAGSAPFVSFRQAHPSGSDKAGSAHASSKRRPPLFLPQMEGKGG